MAEIKTMLSELLTNIPGLDWHHLLIGVGLYITGEVIYYKYKEKKKSRTDNVW